MDSALSSLLASVLIGGSDEELFGGVSHSGGEVYVSGSTASGSFPVTDGVYDESFNGGDMDIFVMRFSSYGSGIDDHTSENGREERSGIPGFPYESILLGVVSAILVLWSIQRRR